MPLRDDASIKQYLLESEQRPGLVLQSGGLLRQVGGVAALGGVLTDRSFVCLHYKLGLDMSLSPCLEASPTAALDDESR